MNPESIPMREDRTCEDKKKSPCVKHPCKPILQPREGEVTYVFLTSILQEHIATTFYCHLKQLASSYLDANPYQSFKIINAHLSHFQNYPRPISQTCLFASSSPLICDAASCILADAVFHSSSWCPLSYSPPPLIGLHNLSAVLFTTLMTLDVASLFTNVPLDVDSLFTNILLDDALTLLQRKLLPKDPDFPFPQALVSWLVHGILLV